MWFNQQANINKWCLPKLKIGWLTGHKIRNHISINARKQYPNSRDKRNDYIAIRTLCGFVYDGQSVQIRQSNMQFATDWHAQWLDRNWPQSPSAVHRLKGTRKIVGFGRIQYHISNLLTSEPNRTDRLTGWKVKTSRSLIKKIPPSPETSNNVWKSGGGGWPMPVTG